MVQRFKKSKIMHAVVSHGGVIYLGGVGADDINVGMEEQTRQICRKIEALLTGAGSDKTKLLTAQIFITDMSAKPDMNKAWLEWLDANDLPCRATIGVADLGEPERLIEVVVTAAANEIGSLTETRQM